MFRQNKTHRQKDLFGWESLLSPSKIARLKQSSGYAFYELIFCNIYEQDFSVLYSKKYSAPNVPVNCMVGSLFLLHQHKWSYAELMEQIDFNMQIRIALGLQDFDTLPFTERSLFNFKKRLAQYETETGQNLLEKVFDRLTGEQIKALSVKTNIQRIDSVLLSSNIRSHSRLSLLVEILRRLHRILSPTEQEYYSDLFAPYLKGGGKYAYTVKSGTQQEHLEALGKVYYQLHTDLFASYEQDGVFQIFHRVYEEHFKLTEEGETPIVLRRLEELDSNCLQSPDDEDATFRTKRKENYQGFTAMGAETCHPDNELNLVTKIALETNNTDDSDMLEANIDEMKQATPDLEELHQDGGFGSQDVDAKAAEHEITLIQTAVKGRKPQVPMEIEGSGQEGYTVNCPNPEHKPVKARKVKRNFRADFDLKKCEICPFKDQCPTKTGRRNRKGIAIFRFSPQDVLRKKRHKAIQKIPKERQTLRSGVESLMRLMHRGEKNTGKLKVRGRFNFELYAFAMGVVINFERIFRYQKAKSGSFSIFRLPAEPLNVLCQNLSRYLGGICAFSNFNLAFLQCKLDS